MSRARWSNTGWGIAGTVVVLALVSVGCTFDRSDESPAGASPTPDGVEIRDADEPDATPATLPDPGVAVGTCELVTYTPPAAPEPQDAELCRPDGVSRDVGIVLVHGGSGRFGNYHGGDAWAEPYVDAGYTTLAIDYFLFDSTEDEAIFPRPEQDVKAGVQYLRATAGSLGLDRERIVVQGFSAGARLGAVALTSADDPYFWGPTTWEGITDRVDAFIGLYSTYDGSLEFDAHYYDGGRDDDDPLVRRRWSEADAVARAERASGPVLLFSGEDDWSLLVDHMEQLADGVERAGHRNEVVVVDDADHGYDQVGGDLTPAGEESLAVALAWLDGIFPPPDP